MQELFMYTSKSAVIGYIPNWFDFLTFFVRTLITENFESDSQNLF